MLKVGELSHWLWVILNIYLLNITSSDHGSNIQNPLGEIFYLMKFSIDWIYIIPKTEFNYWAAYISTSVLKQLGKCSFQTADLYFLF